MRRKSLGLTDCKGPIVMALSLNQKEKTERIIIGELDAIEKWLAGMEGLQAIYDVARPLGTLLYEHEAQEKSVWSEHIGGILMQAVASRTVRKNCESSVLEYIQNKRDCHDMICEFTAIQSWMWYRNNCKVLGSEEKSREYSEQFLELTKSFSVSLQDVFGKWSVEEAWERMQHRLSYTGKSIDKRLDIRYAANNRTEWLLITETYYPMLQYYLRKLMEWELCFRRCSVCNNIFIAESGHYSLCSAECRKIQNRRNKQVFDSKAKENGYDQAYRNACQRMRNRLKKVAGSEAYHGAESWYKDFRAQAIKMKKQINTEVDSRAFSDWMFDQERTFDQICGL